MSFLLLSKCSFENAVLLEVTDLPKKENQSHSGEIGTLLDFNTKDVQKAHGSYYEKAVNGFQIFCTKINLLSIPVFREPFEVS